MRLSILYDVHRISHLTGQFMDEALADADLNGSEFALYSALSAGGAMTVSELATATGAALPSASKQLSRAEERGHIERTANPNDGRSSLVQLTTLGQKFHRETLEPFVVALDSLKIAIGPALEDVRWSLGVLSDALEGVRNEASLQPSPQSQLGYSGEPLTSEQEAEVQQYIEFIRWRSG